MLGQSHRITKEIKVMMTNNILLVISLSLILVAAGFWSLPVDALKKD